MRNGIFVCACWLLILPVLGADAADPAPFELQANLKFQHYVGGDCDNLLVIADPLPPLRRILLSDTFRQYSTTSLLSQSLARNGEDLSQTLARLEANALLVPSEIAIGFPSESLDFVARTTRVAILLGLCASASHADDPTIHNELRTLRAILLETAREIRAPRMTLWVRFREPRSAENVFGAVAAVVSQRAASRGYEAQINRGSIHAKLVVRDFLPPEAVAAMLARLGAATSLDDPNLTEISDVVAGIATEISIERIDDGIRVSVGAPPPQGAVYPLTTLGPLWHSEKPLIAYGRWQISTLKEGFADVEKFWQDWRDTKTGRYARQFDNEDLAGNLTRLLDQVRRAADSGSGQMTFAQGIEAILHEQGHRLVDPLAVSPLVQFLPRDVEIIEVDARRSVSDLMIGALAGFEDRLEKNSLKYDLRGQSGLSTMTDQVRDFYHHRLADFRRLVFDESKLVFEPPFAHLVGSRGNIENLQIQFDAAGGENRLHIHKSPIWEYAAIGRLADPHRATDFSNKFARTFLAGFLNNVEEAYFVPHDLGFGFPTFLLRESILDREPHHLKITVEGDLLPHFVVVDDWMIYSTSVRMSQSIIAARNDAKLRYPLPAASEGKVIAFEVIPADSFARVIEQFGTLLRDALTATGSVSMTGPALRPIAEFGPPPSDGVFMIAETVRLVDGIEWTTEDLGAIRETRFRMNFADKTVAK